MLNLLGVGLIGVVAFGASSLPHAESSAHPGIFTAASAAKVPAATVPTTIHDTLANVPTPRIVIRSISRRPDTLRARIWRIRVVAVQPIREVRKGRTKTAISVVRWRHPRLTGFGTYRRQAAPTQCVSGWRHGARIRAGAERVIVG